MEHALQIDIRRNMRMRFSAKRLTSLYFPCNFASRAARALEKDFRRRARSPSVCERVSRMVSRD